jgi:hypothetical protein
MVSFPDFPCAYVGADYTAVRDEPGMKIASAFLKVPS